MGGPIGLRKRDQTPLNQRGVANSANVRNAFEVHGPILELARRVIRDKNARLILTFEWDYAPYTIPQNHPLFPDFVIIGLPASEASNALVLPAVGHELGHVLWLKQKLNVSYPKKINRRIIDLIKSKYRDRYRTLFHISPTQADEIGNRASWAQAAEYALRQTEEIFCDFTGLYLFGGCYLNSFEYMLSPALHETRHPKYPSVKARAGFLTGNCYKLGIKAPRNFELQFSAQKSPFDGKERISFDPDADTFQLELADEVASSFAPKLADDVFKFCKARELSPPNLKTAAKLSSQFLRGVPAEQAAGLGEVLSAGWLTYAGSDFMPDANDNRRMRALNELILKSIEMYEIERLTKNAA